MEFSKSKSQRSALTLPNDVPGPGAYNIISPENVYKHGAMLERANRFTKEADGTDTFGLYDTGVKENMKPLGASSKMGSSTDRMRQQLEDQRQRLTAQHEKELRKLQSKLVKSEAERNEDRAEVGELKLSLRTSATTESVLRASLEKSEASLNRHATSIPSFQRKLEDLTKSHSDSRKRKEAEIGELKLAVDELKQELSISTVALKREEERSSEWTSLLTASQSTLESTCSAAHQLLSTRSRISPIELDVLRSTSATYELRVVRLERQLSATQAQVAALVELNSQLAASNALLGSDLRDREAHLENLIADTMWQRNHQRSEKEWRQRCRSDFRESLALQEEIKLLTCSQELDLELNAISKQNEDQKEMQRQEELRIMQDELAIAEGELSLAMNEEIPSLEETIESLEASLQQSVDDQAMVASTLEATEAILMDLENTAKENQQILEGELEEMQRSANEKAILAERLDKEKKRLTTLLSQSRAAEQGLREELASCTITLSTLPVLLSKNAQLHATVDELSRRTKAAEMEARDLGEYNSQLAGNDNPLAKIDFLAKVRGELMDSRKKHLLTTSSLATALSTNTALLAELNALRSISPTLPNLSTLTASLSRSRALLPDNLDSETKRSRVARILEEQEESYEIEGDDDVRTEFEMTNVTIDRTGEIGRHVEVRRAARGGVLLSSIPSIIEEDEETQVFERIGGIKMVGKMSVSELV